MNILSLGAGVQSTAMALMAAHGEITPMPDAAIFADTGWEPLAIYAHLNWLEGELPFPLYRVSGGNIKDDLMQGLNSDGGRFASIPYWVKNTDGSYDVFFGPKAPSGRENNWVQTVPGKGWNMLFRLYGPLEPWFEKAWRPGDPEVVP